MFRRAVASWLGLIFVAGLLAAQPKPSSDLLLPYFEVDLEGGEATTVFAVVNTLDKQVDVAAALYTNWGLPVVSTQLRLKPGEVWTADLRAWIVEGNLPGRKPLTAGEMLLVQAMLSGQPSPTDGLYHATDVAFGRATGYLTIRTLRSGGGKKAAKPDALRGEGFLIDPEQGPARGHDLVDIDKTTSKELCTRHNLRHLSGIGLAEARVIVWRDLTGQILPAPVPVDRRRQIDVSIYAPDGRLLRTQSLQLLPAEQVPVTELGLTEPLGRIEIATTDASVAVIQDSSGGPLFETSCVQSGGTPGPTPEPKTAVQITTLANGHDANTPPGPSVPIGSTVTWSYRVTNSGTDPLSQISVRDEQGGAVSCPKGTLNPGQSLTCTAKATAQACQHRNVATVTAKIKKGKKGGGTATAQDPGHYFGDEGAAIEIVTSTNGADANVPTGPTVLAGSPIAWTYLITNTGKVRLLSVRVSDDHGAAVVCPHTTLGPGEAMTCEAVGVAAAGQFGNIATVTGTASCGEVSDSDPSHYFGESEKNVQIRALTNGFDADFPPGPSIAVGGPVTWEYIVTNTGKFPLNALAVSDDKGTAVSCPKAGLTAGESMTCIARGVASSCQNAAFASVTGQTPDGTRVAASNPAHYFGQAEASILIKTSANGNDADLPPGPSVPIGSPVQWTYTLTNTGKVALSGLVVTDDKGAPVACPRTDLRPGESIGCSATGTAVSGDFKNLGTVTANPPCGAPVRDDDPSHYRGIGDPGIRIKTLVNNQDANTPPGPTIQVGGPVSWTYVVTNTGQFALTGILVSDSRGAAVSCPLTELQLGQAMTCTASGTAKACQFDNQGTVSGKTSTGQTVIAVDPSYYLGEHHPDVKIETAVNNVEADAAPGPTIMVGSPVSWVYTVTNAGDAPLSAILITDDQGAAVSCPKTTLQVGESMACTASGVAKEGQFKNVGTVTASPPCGAQITAQDPSHYMGGGSGAIGIETFVNGQDADGPPGPSIPIGDPVGWTYTVKNLGLVSLSAINVIDNRGVAVTCPKAALQPGETMSCTGAGIAKACQNDNLGSVTAQTADGAQVAAADPSYYTGQGQPGLSFELSANGQGADVPPGPTITVGTPVTWLFTITNIGNVALSNVVASENKGAAVECPKTTLQPGEVMSCYAFGTAIEGPFSNLGTVTATPACGSPGTSPIMATDPSNYFGGGGSELQLRTLVNFQDIGQPPGPSVPMGSTINWSYIVKNMGQLSLSQLQVGDLNGALASCPKTTLQPGESVTCTATSTAAACQNTHVGSATSRNPSNQEVSAIDASFYTGTFTAKLDIETAVNGNNADTPKGPYIELGSAVNWTYTVTNIGNIQLTNVRVADDQSALVTCPFDTLNAGASMVCTASGGAVSGQFRNIGTATGDTSCGTQASAQDASHYFGTLPVSIDIQKLTNNQDVAQPSELVIPVGSAVQWTYTVKNTGLAPLTGVVVNDDKGVTVTCPKAELQPAESMTCTGSGTAVSGNYTNTGSVVAQTPYGGTVNDSDTSHYQGVAASIDIETTTNGQEDDSLAGASVVVATALTRSYTVTNSGPFALSSVVVTDTSGLTVDCTGQTTLAAGASMTCTAAGTSACGNHAGTSAVTAATSTGQSATDSDLNNYTGAETPSVTIVSSVSGSDANTAPGPTLFTFASGIATHVVTNNGNIQINGIAVTDEKGTTGSCGIPATLNPGQSFTCIATFTPSQGQHHNNGTVSAKSTCGTPVSDTDPAYYLGCDFFGICS
jgi:large repetitive protein